MRQGAVHSTELWGSTFIHQQTTINATFCRWKIHYVNCYLLKRLGLRLDDKMIMKMFKENNDVYLT